MFVSLQVGFKRIATTIAVALFSAVTVLGAVFASTPYPWHWQHLSSEQLMEKVTAFRNAELYDSVLACYSIVANRLSDKNTPDEQRLCIIAASRMGHLYQYHYYNYQKAADCLLAAQEAGMQTNDSALIAYIYHELGCLYLQYETAQEGSDFKQSISNLKSAFRFAPVDDPLFDLYAFNLITKGLQYNQIEKITQELRVYEQLHPQPNFVTHLCKAAWAVRHGKYDEALRWTGRSLESVEKSDFDNDSRARLRAILTILQSILLDWAGRDSESLVELENYIGIVREFDLLEGVPDYYNQLSLYYNKHGDKFKANECRLKYYESVDSLTGLTQLSYLSKAPLVFDLQKAAEEARMKEIQHEHVMEILWMVIIAAIICLALLVLLFLRNRQLNEQNEALYKQSVEQLALIDEARKQVSIVQPLPDLDNEENIEVEPAAKTEVDEGVLSDIYQRVKSVMETSDEIYDESFSLAKLHQLVGSNTKYISRAIGQFAHSDFKTLLSQYRIREACRRMNDVEKYGKFTIEAIAKSVGVTSRTSFIQNFKKQTGLTPSAYFKIAHEKAESNDPDIA